MACLLLSECGRRTPSPRLASPALALPRLSRGLAWLDFTCPFFLSCCSARLTLPFPSHHRLLFFFPSAVGWFVPADSLARWLARSLAQIDHITIPDPRGGSFPPMKRVEEVFDCWFESGSMPYAQQHYPFENKETFEKGFPADFIAGACVRACAWVPVVKRLHACLSACPLSGSLCVLASFAPRGF